MSNSHRKLNLGSPPTNHPEKCRIAIWVMTKIQIEKMDKAQKFYLCIDLRTRIFKKWARNRENRGEEGQIGTYK